MNVIVNYPKDRIAIDNLNDRIAEFKATLIFESIDKINNSNDEKSY